jgi:hypothetical protein
MAQRMPRHPHNKPVQAGKSNSPGGNEIPPADSKVTDSQGRLVDRFRLVTGNVALVGALLYAYVTFVGLSYSVDLYWTIGFNPLNLFETADFLLAGLRHPIVLVLPVIVVVYMLFFLASSGSEGVSSPSDRRRNSTVTLKIAVFFGALTAVFLPMGASYYVVRNCGQPAQIYLRKDSLAEQEPSKPLSRSIIGSTQKFLLLDELQSDPAYSVLPIESVAEIEVRHLPARSILCLFFM